MESLTHSHGCICCCKTLCGDKGSPELGIGFCWTGWSWRRISEITSSGGEILFILCPSVDWLPDEWELDSPPFPLVCSPLGRGAAVTGRLCLLVLVPVLGSVPQPFASAGAASCKVPGEGARAEHQGCHQGLDMTETTTWWNYKMIGFRGVVIFFLCSSHPLHRDVIRAKWKEIRGRRWDRYAATLLQIIQYHALV